MFLKKIFLFVFITLNSFLFSQNIEVNIINSFSVNSIASASGIEKINNTIYIISDDQSNIFHTNDFDIIKKTKIIDYKDGRINKIYKPDFEALGKIEINNKVLILIVSSGSKIDYRDTIYLFNPKTKKIISKRNFRDIYNQMEKDAALSEWASINIEAISTNKNYVYLFQRGNIDGKNIVFKFNKTDFFQYLVGKRNSLDFELKNFSLPTLDDVKSGFSGACYLNESEMIFTASLETNPNAYSDGDILGSYVGILNYNTKEINYTILKSNNNILITKLESVCIINKINKKEYKLLLSSDNDNGISEFYNIILSK